VQDIPLYEYLRHEAKETGPYILPVPFFNVLNGGKHSGNTMAFQEVMVAPTGAQSLEEGVRMGAEVYHALKSIIADTYGAPGASSLALPAIPRHDNYQLTMILAPTQQRPG